MVNFGWSNYERLGPEPIASGPAAVSSGIGRMDVFVRGTDNALWHKGFDTNIGWSNYEQLGPEPIAAGPGVCSRAPGLLDVFVKGTDDALWHKGFDTNTGWSGYERLGPEPIASGPAAVSSGIGRMDVFVRGTDNALWHKGFDTNIGWSNYEQLGPEPIASAPAAVLWGSGRMDVFVQGTDNALWHKVFDVGAAPHISIRVLEMNMHGGHNAAEADVLGEQADFIQSLQPDVVMLQEAGYAQVEQLSIKTGLRHYARGTTSGNALLSRNQLTDVVETIVPRPWWLQFTHDSGYIAATANIAGRPYRLIGTHLHLDAGYRKVHLLRLAETLRALPRALCPILGGDFNMGSEDPDMIPIKAYVDEAYRMVHPDQPDTPSIDMVWIGKGVHHEIDSYTVIPATHVTDHDSVILVAMTRWD
jgi:endonuclease/exonuclease/phosphatase family metal-dependent hydrolase